MLPPIGVTAPNIFNPEPNISFKDKKDKLEVKITVGGFSQHYHIP